MSRKTPVIGLCLAFSLAATAPALEPGDAAPPLKVAKWLVGKGLDPAQPDGKSIYVVEIWGTWCPPCRVTIPHLNRLHAKFKDKGVVIMGITAETADVVDEFLKTTPMHYNVGLDDKEATGKAYATKDGSVPRAFVIGKNGKVLWTGHPLDGMDRVIGRVLAGTFDPKVAAQAAQLENGIQDILKSNDMDALVTVLDKLLRLEPDNPKYYVLKLATLTQDEKPNLEAVKVLFAAWAKGCADYDQGLRILVSAMLDQDYSVRDPELIMSAANKAAVLGAGDPEISTMMATVYGHFGMIDQAIETLKKAIQTADPDIRRKMQAQLDYFTKIKRLTK